ncbi:hypothetical protein I2486_21420 [Cellulophaga sp. E16_2]|uniref:hypothetical protein n=1 Tax=Cellulophaga sp. E16_2 TaxID=2789297 RepID=UPI001A931D74|nr:hypothetical protein [Cellulophaga sp. E16_2]MBO0593968.1 hypothetical protein [Cellulophaga sp. E16_2]
MNKKEIFNILRNSFQDKMDTFQITSMEDRLIFTKRNDGLEYQNSIRCQYFGETSTLSPQGNSFRSEQIESDFMTYLIEPLKSYYNSSSTIHLSSKRFKNFDKIDFYKFTSLTQLENFIEYYLAYHQSVCEEFWYKIKSIKDIGYFLAQLPYENHTEILVGGTFPTQMFKKMYILKKCGHLERYKEYKFKFSEQLETFPIRKPNRKEEYELFKENFNQLISKLEE